MNDTIDLRKKKKDDVIKMLNDKKYSVINDDDEFKYLVKMSMDSVTEENIHKLTNEHDKKAQELESIKMKTIQQMWVEELELLTVQFQEYKKQRQTISMPGVVKKEKPIKKLKIAKE